MILGQAMEFSEHMAKEEVNTVHVRHDERFACLLIYIYILFQSKIQSSGWGLGPWPGNHWGGAKDRLQPRTEDQTERELPCSLLSTERAYGHKVRQMEA